jgi:hypothetical protein
MSNPQLITVDVTLDGDLQLKIVWAKDGRQFMPYYIDRTMVEEYSEEIRTCLQSLLDRGMSSGLQGSGDLLKQLAQAGAKLYSSLFYPDGQNNQIQPSTIQNWLRAFQEPVQISFSVDNRVHVPWGLIYDANADTLKGRTEDDAIDNYQSFWCLKYKLSSVYSKVSPMGVDVVRPADAFKMLSVVNKAVFENAASNLGNSDWSAVCDWIFNNFGKPLYSSNEFFEKWKEIEEKIGLLFFYCHANGTSIALDVEDKFSVSEFKRQTVRRTTAQDQPACMVFINGCNTAIGDPGGGFLEATGRAGFCGFIGTETKVPDVFALRFGLAFLFYFLYEGLPVYEVMDRLRRQHWPLSLIYSTYCYPLLKVNPEPVKSRSPLSMQARENFSLLNPLGTSQM